MIELILLLQLGCMWLDDGNCFDIQAFFLTINCIYTQWKSMAAYSTKDLNLVF